MEYDWDGIEVEPQSDDDRERDRLASEDERMEQAERYWADPEEGDDDV